MTDPEDAGARKDSMTRGTDREDCLRSISETGQADNSMIIKAVKEPEDSKSSDGKNGKIDKCYSKILLIAVRTIQKRLWTKLYNLRSQL